MQKFILFTFLGLINIGLLQAQNLKPYTIGAKTSASISEVKTQVKSALEANGFEILGEYQPAKDNNRWMIAVSSDDLKSAVRKVGGLTGFAAALRVAITREGGETIISYTTPAYWGNAYFRKDFSKVSSNYNTVAANLKTALSSLGSSGGIAFGSEDGHSVSNLQKYHYMFGMPYFDDNQKLGEFANYAAAVTKVDANLAKGITNLKKVYSVELKDKNIKLYGIGLSGADGEEDFLPTIDISQPKHTASLPYEMLILDNKVYMLHGRFRIALSFPDLTMGTFTKIMSTPKNIRKLLEQATK